MLIVCTWFWGDKYDWSYVDKLAAGVHRNLKQPHDFAVFTPGPEDEALTGRGCLCRMRMFDPEWQERVGLGIGDRLVCLDLDVVITGELDILFDVPNPFKILGGANAANPCPFNGSVMLLRTGARPDVWRDLSIEAASKVPWYAFPDDQSWLWHKIPNAATWECGPRSGIWSFRKRGWPKNDKLPKDARIVAFPGKRDPSQFEELEWVRENWIVDQS